MNKEEVATSSVFVTLNENNPLSNDKVTAIKTLVSSSFKGMTNDNVNIIDDAGRSYAGNDNSVENYNVSDQMGMKQGFENKLNNSIKRFLENLFGDGNVDIRANVNMDFNSEITNIVEFSPPIEDESEGLVRSMEKIEEHTVGGSNANPAGTESNTEDTVDYANEDDSSSKYDKASEVINYELNEINKEIKKTPGNIESVTVAVLIDKNSIDGELSDDRQKEIEDLIYAATGIDTQEVVVSTGEFAKAKFPGESEKDNESGLPIWAYILIIVPIVSILGFFLFSIYRRRKQNEIIRQDEDTLGNYELSETEHIKDIDFDTEKSQYKSKINDFAKKKPDAVAQLLRSWLNEE